MEANVGIMSLEGEKELGEPPPGWEGVGVEGGGGWGWKWGG